MSVTGGGTLGGGKPQARPVPMLVNGRGQFVFHDLPGGAVTLRATSPGYIGSGSGVRSAGSDPVPVTLADGQHIADVTIRMWRFASLEGAVRDESGDPIADVPVHLLQRTVGERRVVPGRVATTDDRGVFRFASLEPGRYLVVVPSGTASMPASVAADYRSQMSENVPALMRGQSAGAPHPSIAGFRVGGTLLQPSTALAQDAPPPEADGRVQIYRTTFYPGAADLSQAETLDVAAGDDRTGVDLTLPLVTTVSVSGVVADANNLMLRLVAVDVDDWIGDDSFVAASTTTDDDGAFTFLGVPPGRYVIEGRTNQSWVRAAVTVANVPVTNLSLAERPGLRVTGRYRFAGTNPIATFGRGGWAWLVPINRGDSKPVAIEPDGSFSIDSCDPGRYAFQVAVLNSEGRSWTVSSITANGTDLLAQPFDLESDLTDVVITLTDHSTEIAGTVREGDEPLDVLVLPADYQAASDAGVLRLRMATVEISSGRFAVQGLPTGNYLVAAIPRGEVPVWTRAMSAIAAQATPVTLTDRARVTVDLKPVVIR
jgi:protocatechuate 3,4-dioxygenase beta subunit